MTEYGRLAALREMLHQMEHDMGLSDLSRAERDVYYAAWLLSQGDPVINSEELRMHPLIGALSRSTFYRVLRTLTDHGWLASAGSQRSGLYRIGRQA